MRKTAILQSNYIPWKGYFDIINSVDEFIIYDDVQYTKNDWRNRNKIVSAQGLLWLTIPVKKERLAQKIYETQTADSNWINRHVKSIRGNYAKSQFYKEFSDIIFSTYEACRPERSLSRINYIFLKAICKILNIDANITFSFDYPPTEGQTGRLVSLCEAVNSACYLSGPAARAYLDERLFAVRGLKLEYMDYSGYPTYPQQFGQTFEHGVSVLDLIFNTGPQAPYYIWGWREKCGK